MAFRNWMRTLIICAISAIAAGTTGVSASETYPTRSVDIIVPYAPGGATDTVARIVAEEMRRISGQAFVVQNKPGASGLIALDQLVRAKPDGYTIMLGNVTSNSITPVLLRDKMSYDYDAMVEPVALVAAVPALIASTTVNFAPVNMKEVLAAAKANPGTISYGSAGVGSAPHLSFLALESRTGTRFLHIPFKDGAGASLTDTVRGEIKLNFLNVATALPLIADGRLRPLVVTSKERLPQLPHVPTIAEEGLDYIRGVNWQGFFAPQGTPGDVIEKLHALVNQAVASESVQKAFRAKSVPAATTESPQDFAKYVRAETDAWRKLVEQTNLKIE